METKVYNAPCHTNVTQLLNSFDKLPEIFHLTRIDHFTNDEKVQKVVSDRLNGNINTIEETEKKPGNWLK